MVRHIAWCDNSALETCPWCEEDLSIYFRGEDFWTGSEAPEFLDPVIDWESVVTDTDLENYFEDKCPFCKKTLSVYVEFEPQFWVSQRG